MSATTLPSSRTNTNRYSWVEIEALIDSGNVNGKLTRADVPTPALMLTLDDFEYNVAKMVGHCRKHGLALRPHGKTHKCPEIAKRLIQAGAIGACTAKLSEAEVFSAHGISGLLITTPVVGRHKLERAVRLTKKSPDTKFCVDDQQNARDLSDAARSAGVQPNIMLDLHVGMRDGVLPGQPALDLARLIASLPNLKLVGIQAYAGQASHVAGFAERKQASAEAMAAAIETKRLLKRDGIELSLMSSGSTGTYNVDASLDGITELQPGSFMFMDLDYNRIGGQEGSIYRDFRNSLTVLTTVVSKPTRKLAVVDGGYKSFSTDRPFCPETKTPLGIVYTWGGDEHGRLNLTDATVEINVGDRLEFVPPHCDPTVNLHDRIFCTRGENVEAIWKIAARGMSQ